MSKLGKSLKAATVCPFTPLQPAGGTNPWTIKSNAFPQTDITHVSEFWRLKYAHVTVDTFPNVIVASARRTTSDGINHVLYTFPS